MLDRLDQATAHSSVSMIRSVRLRCGEITKRVEQDEMVVTVELLFDEKAFPGSATGPNTEDSFHECIASATLNAACSFLELADSPFQLMGIRHITTTPVPICMALIEFSDGEHGNVLVGSVELTNDINVCIQRATMDAINRKVSALYRGDDLES